LKRKLSTEQILLITLLLYFVFFLNIVRGSKVPLVSGSNFNVYLSTGDELQFQHLAIDEWMDEFTVKIKVGSGVLNGSNGRIEMWTSEGELTFLSLDTATLTPFNASIIVNGVVHDGATRINNGDNVKIRWAAPAFEPYTPIMFVIGMGGLFAMFVGPAYCIQMVKKGRYWDAAVNGFTITAIGVAFFIAWLWG